MRRIYNARFCKNIAKITISHVFCWYFTNITLKITMILHFFFIFFHLPNLWCDFWVFFGLRGKGWTGELRIAFSESPVFCDILRGFLFFTSDVGFTLFHWYLYIFSFSSLLYLSNSWVSVKNIHETRGVLPEVFDFCLFSI